MLANEGGWRGAKQAWTDTLPVVRLIIVVLMAVSFALVFAELARQDSLNSNGRSEPLASRCGDSVGTPCPTQRAL